MENVFCPLDSRSAIVLFEMKAHSNFKGDLIHTRIGIQSKIGKEQTDPQLKIVISNTAF